MIAHALARFRAFAQIVPLLGFLAGGAGSLQSAPVNSLTNGPAGIALVPGSYGLFELGSLGGAGSVAYDINNDGTVTGSASDGAGNNFAFIWVDGVMQKLPALAGGRFSEGRAVSGFGAVGGVAEELIKTPGGQSVFERKAVRWQNGSIQTFGNPGDSVAPDVHGMTTGGSLVGSVGTVVTNLDGTTRIVIRAARWLGGRGDFLTSDPLGFGQAFGVSGSGTYVVGSYRTALGDPVHASVFNADPPLDIHNLTEHPSSVALAANDSGVVVGYTFRDPLPTFYEPFIWTAKNGMRRPALPSSAPYGQVMDLTETGVAVGVVRDAGVMMWLNAGQTNEIGVNVQGLLPRNAPVVNGPVAVNDYGEIAAVRVAGTTHAVLLYPTNRWRQVAGTIQTLATENAKNRSGTFPTFTYPLEALPVELMAVRGSKLVPIARQTTDAQGHYAFLMRASSDTQFTLRLTLSDSTGWVDVFDAAADTNSPAWLRTPAFPVEGDVRADVTMLINADPGNADPNECEYQLNGQSFGIEPMAAPVTAAASNSDAMRFAHLTVFYRNIRLAAQFATRRLGLTMPRVPAYAFEARGQFDPFNEQIWKSGVTNEAVHLNFFDDAASYFTERPPSLHFPAISSSFNQPTLGLPGNPFGYAALQIVTNTVTGTSTNLSIVWGLDRPDNREFHEYGHYIMYRSSLGGFDAFPPLATNQFKPPYDLNHHGLENSNSTDSWIEGFAEFVSCVISDTMLDRSEKLYPDAYFSQGAAIRLENNYAYAKYLTRYPTYEEFALAALLWDLHDPLNPKDHDGLSMPVEDWWQVMNSNGPKLLDFKAVYDAFAEFGVRFPTRLNPDEWAARCVVSELFDDRTFTDFRVNGVYDKGNPGDPSDPGETIGITSWNPAHQHRRDFSPRTWLTLKVQSSDGRPVTNVTYGIQVNYEPPLEELSFSWNFPTYGPASVALPFVLPPHPCTVVVTPQAPGLGRIPSFSFSTAEAEAHFDARASQVDGELVAHTFIAAERPRIEIALVAGGTRLEFSWPVADPPYILEYTRDLSPPVLWGLPPGTPVTIGDRKVLQLPVPVGTVFLRIRQP